MAASRSVTGSPTIRLREDGTVPLDNPFVRSKGALPEIWTYGHRNPAGMEQPVYYYDPDIAPSGMIFYTGAAFPRWRGNIFIGSLSMRYLARLVVEGDHVIHEERLLLDLAWKVRAVQQAPDGSVFVGVDGGLLVQIAPAIAAGPHPWA